MANNVFKVEHGLEVLNGANVANVVSVGANVSLSTTQLSIGNSTVNAVASSTEIRVGNSSVNTVVSATSIDTDGSLAVLNAATFSNTVSITGLTTASGGLNVGANVILTTSQIGIGNSTVNNVLTQTALRIGNTTVNTVINGTGIDTDGSLAVLNAAAFSNTLSTGGKATLYSAEVTTDITINGNIITGPNTVLAISGSVNGSIIPSVNSLILGNTSNRWSTVFANTIELSSPGTANVVGAAVFGNTISVTGNAYFGASINVGTATINSTFYSQTANNANNLNSQPASYYTNATNISTGTLAGARMVSANNSVQGAVIVADSVANVSTTVAAAANSVKTAYDTAIAANTRAASAQTAASSAYSNAVSVASSDATTKAGTAYTNAASYADTKAATAYSNATSYADTKASAAYTNATSYADTKAATAYSNATTYAASISATAYSNAIAYSANVSTANSGTLNAARLPQANTTANGAVILLDSVANTSISVYAPTANAVKTAYDSAIAANTRAASAQTAATSAYSNATSYAATIAGTAYSNATSYAATIAGTAYTNATSYAATIAGTAYSNATSFAANATNISSGTLAAARLGTASNVQFNAVGVGTAPGVSGSIRATDDITAYYSDERLKLKIGPIINALDKVKHLEGFRYRANELASTFGYDTERIHVGLSAQRVQDVLPEVVDLAPFDTVYENGQCRSISGNNYLTMHYDRVVALLVEAIKELDEKLEKHIKGS